jgi:hypothetical protein
MTGSSICAEARPVRSEANSPLSAVKRAVHAPLKVVHVDLDLVFRHSERPIFSFCLLSF